MLSRKRIEVVPDDEREIIDVARRFASQYDFTLTSGGIGPTHDDITYRSLATAFGQDLTLHAECQKRMKASNIYKYGAEAWAEQSEEQRLARQRMALFPTEAEVLFVKDSLWVPVVNLEKVYILPGIPSLFQALLDNLDPYLQLPSADVRPLRLLIRVTCPESELAPGLAKIQAQAQDIKIGSYPSSIHDTSGVTISLIGKSHTDVRSLADRIAKQYSGEISSSDLD